MASDRWKESGERSERLERPGEAARGGSRDETPASGIPEFVRRALTAGFSGFFLTGEALREAVGDSLPKEWADFASEQSARARNEFIERLSFEMGRAVESIDWAAVIATLLDGRTLEVRAEIRLGDRQSDGTPSLNVRLIDDD